MLLLKYKYPQERKKITLQAHYLCSTFFKGLFQEYLMKKITFYQQWYLRELSCLQKYTALLYVSSAPRERGDGLSHTLQPPSHLFLQVYTKRSSCTIKYKHP